MNTNAIIAVTVLIVSTFNYLMLKHYVSGRQSFLEFLVVLPFFLFSFLCPILTIILFKLEMDIDSKYLYTAINLMIQVFILTHALNQRK